MRPGESILLTTWTAAQRISQLVTHELAAAGASTPHFALLVMIALREPITPKALAEAMGFPPTTLSDYLAELSDLGHIRRTPNPADGRSHLIRTTAAGRRAFERGSTASIRAHRRLEERLTRPLEEIAEAIDELTRALDAALAAQGSDAAASLG